MASPYQTLDKRQSRLLVLRPGEDAAPLECVLQPFSLDTPPHFEALSYTWGEPLKKQEHIRTGRTEFSTDRKITKRPANSHPHLLPERCGNSSEDEIPELHEDSGGSDDDCSELSEFEGPYERAPDRTVHHFPHSFSGRTDDIHSLSIDGNLCVGSHVIPLRRNLEQALRRLRLPDQDRMFWIDAICINQADVTERGYQVSQMGNIYKSAAAVTVWLGEASEDSDHALKFVKDLWQMKTSQGTQEVGTGSDWMAFKSYFAPYGYFTTERIVQLRGFSYLVNRNWFHRRWVVQEVAFAKDIVVQCGHSKVSWAEFANAIAILHNHHRKIVHIVRAFHNEEGNEDWTLGRAFAGNSIHGTSDIQAHAASQFLFITSCLLRKDPEHSTVSHLVDIRTLVSKLWALQASDARDTIFALYSLARDTVGSDGLYPDYTRSPSEIFVDFVRHAITSTDSLDIILQRWAPEVMNLPTWIPAVSAVNEAGVLFRDDAINKLEQEDSEPRNFYAASSNSRPSFKIYREGPTHILETRGFVIATVETAADVAYQGKIPIDWSVYADPDQYWSLFVGARTTTGNSPPISYKSPCLAMFEGWSLRIHSPFLDDPDMILDVVNINQLIDVYHGSAHDDITLPKFYLAKFPQSEDTLNFLERMRVCTWNRRLIKTTGGHLGLGPAKTKVDDIICILMGCSLPVILRPNGGEFNMIGEVYVHGMSDGEAMEGLQNGEYEMRKFRLV